MGGYSTLVLKNQFGEESNNFVLGGTSQISCSFVVDAANGNGLGVKSLKQSTQYPYISNVFMHTSATPATGNPNPAVGVIVVKFAEQLSNYNGGFGSFVAPLSGSSVNVTSGLTQYAPYVITSLGTTTAANWQALGLATNVTPAVGVCFIASTASAGTGTGTVQAPAAAGAGFISIQPLADPNLTIIGTGGGYLVLGCYAATNSSTTTQVLTAPPTGQVIGLTFNMVPSAGALPLI